MLKKQEKKTITRLRGLLRSQLQQIVADHKGNAFILEKIVKKIVMILLLSLLFKNFGITKL